MRAYILPALSLLLLAAHATEPPVAQVTVSAQRDPEWASYRHAYKAAAYFAAFTRDRPLIQADMQLRPLARTARMEGLRVHLAGAHTQADIPVDALGRAQIPMDKLAYEDDAVLSLNRQKGLYYFSGRYSIRTRDDGIYPVAQLQAACGQLIDAQRDAGYSMRLIGKHCAAA
jgi:hypothetical protein